MYLSRKCRNSRDGHYSGPFDRQQWWAKWFGSLPHSILTSTKQSNFSPQ